MLLWCPLSWKKIIIKHHKKEWIPGSKFRYGLEDQHGGEGIRFVGKPVQQCRLGTAPVSSQASHNGRQTSGTSGEAQTEEIFNPAIEKRDPRKMLLETHTANPSVAVA